MLFGDLKGLHISMLYKLIRVNSLQLPLIILCAVLASCGDYHHGCYGCGNFTPTEFSNGVVSADFNGDGFADAVALSTVQPAVSPIASNIKAYLTTGAGVFAAPVATPDGFNPLYIASADINGDGLMDVVTASFDDGALGVVLNRPSETAIDEIVPHWGYHASEPPVLFVGGPVQPNAAICVGRTQDATREHPSVLEATHDAEADGFSPLIGDLGTVDLNRAPEEVGVAFSGLRVFTGYSGWGPGQLEEEIEAGAWFVVEGRQADVLSAEPSGLWERVLRRQGGWLAVLARHPVDASLN